MGTQNETFLAWFMRRFGWFWIFCGLIGFLIAYLHKNSPAGFRNIEIIGAVLATLLSLFYLVCLPQKRLNILERLALIVAAVGGALLAAKLFLPDLLPYHTAIYYVVGFVCVFILDPWIDHLGYNPKNLESTRPKRTLP